MRKTNSQKLNELIHQVRMQDRVNAGVAKARFAGEAKYSVPSLERLMRGARASEDQRAGTLKAAKKWGLQIEEDELFPVVDDDEEVAAS